MKLPCEDCICYATCKSQYEEQYKKAPYHLKNLVLCRTMLTDKCELLFNYLFGKDEPMSLQHLTNWYVTNTFHDFFQKDVKINEEREDLFYEDKIPTYF